MHMAIRPAGLLACIVVMFATCCTAQPTLNTTAVLLASGINANTNSSNLATIYSFAGLSGGVLTCALAVVAEVGALKVIPRSNNKGDGDGEGTFIVLGNTSLSASACTACGNAHACPDYLGRFLFTGDPWTSCEPDPKHATYDSSYTAYVCQPAATTALEVAYSFAVIITILLITIISCYCCRCCPLYRRRLARARQLEMEAGMMYGVQMQGQAGMIPRMAIGFPSNNNPTLVATIAAPQQWGQLPHQQQQMFQQQPQQPEQQQRQQQQWQQQPPQQNQRPDRQQQQPRAEGRDQGRGGPPSTTSSTRRGDRR